MSNPALANNPALNGKTLTAEELRRIYDQPAAQVPHEAGTEDAMGAGAQLPPDVTPSANPMTFENTIAKTVLLFVVALASAAVGWFFPLLGLVGALVGLVLGLVNSFKKEPSVPLIIGYAVAEGLFLGAISQFFEAQWAGIITQALIGTAAVFGVTLALFRSGKVRTSPKLTKMFMVAMLGYLVFGLINFGLMAFNVVQDPFGLHTSVRIFGIPLGVLIGVVVVLLAAYSLVMDFELIQNGVQNRVPEKWGWSAAFGLMVTVVWLYLEILRLLAILRSSD